MRDIDAHIASYVATLSHYRRAHAPNRLYLFPELSISEMHKNFVEDGGKCGYHTYGKQLVANNISFAKLGEEECEDCLSFEQHLCSNETEICDICTTQQIYLARSEASRKEYRLGSSQVNSFTLSYFSVDLQKVIMLPRLPGIRIVAFTKRIIAYNETIAPLGEMKKVKGKSMSPYAVS